MSYDDELRNAYDEALRAYEAAKLRNGNHPATFCQFVEAELALAKHLGRSPPLRWPTRRPSSATS